MMVRRGVLAVVLAAGWLLQPVATQSPPITAETVAALAFRTIGPANMSGRVVDLAVVERDPFTYYVATATGGLWKTADNGVTFVPVFEREAVHSIGAVTLHQAHPDMVWVGTGERANRQSSSWGDGVYKSTDGGRTWTNMGLRDTHHIGRIVLHPDDPNIVYVAAMGRLWGPNRERGLFKSTDGGGSWRNILFVDEDTGVVDMAMDPSDPTILYAATYQRRRRAYGFHGGGPGGGLHKSTDGGATWRELAGGLPAGDKGRIGISIYRKDPRIVYVCIEQGERYTASTAYEQRLGGVYRSEDKGDTWQHMSDWNPRPMYASQILVDPNDDRRIYMQNSFSYSDDAGKTFTAPRQSLHGDDRVVWVNPRDSRHLIKGDDGGVGISYDRGLKWLYVTSLPVSQWYRVSVDMRRPFWVYGGLQDNGTWAGPSATYYSSGILNEDWSRTGGGDGFLSLVDPRDNRTLYTESQFLGLTRVDLETREVRWIRPGDPQGHIQGRRNWATWGQPGAPEPLLGNAMQPANWDAPFILSPHDPGTLYAGTNRLWLSTDRGDTWVSLGDLTEGVDRSQLRIMGQTPGPSTLSLDDGVPYWPTLTAIAESPLRRGLLYVGTDDGNLHVSRDGGKTFANVARRLPGLPEGSWVSGIEPSRHDEGRVYVAFDNHASDDFENYLYRSIDYGQTWSAIVGDLPPRRVVKAVHEDPRNASLIYVGTEFGFFASADQGRHWISMRNNMPTVPVNDFVVHPRDNDLVLATHGRGIWILDNIASLQELTPQVLASDVHLFTIEPAAMIRYSNPKAHAGDMIFRGQNPPAGAIIDVYLRAAPGDAVTVTIHDPSGREIRRLTPAAHAGINRVVWDLRFEPLPPSAARASEDERPSARLDGPFVVPGEYLVRLNAAGQTREQTMRVDEDPRIQVSAQDRRRWTEILVEMADLYRRVIGMSRTAEESAAAGSEVESLRGSLKELSSRLTTLYADVSRSTGRPTADQRSRLEYYAKVAADLNVRLQALAR